MGTPIKQELGNVYGLLTVVEFAGQDSNGHALWKCKCSCGNKTPPIYGNNLRRGTTQSCGCLLLQQVTKHGATRRGNRLPEYAIFQSAKQRCTNPKDSGWKNYGGRGIEFLLDSFEQFYTEIGPRPSPKYTLDRINNDGHYESGNVKWSTRKEQLQNRRERLRIDEYSDERLLMECSRRGLLERSAAEEDQAQIA